MVAEGLRDSCRRSGCGNDDWTLRNDVVGLCSLDVVPRLGVLGSLALSVVLFAYTWSDIVAMDRSYACCHGTYGVVELVVVLPCHILQRHSQHSRTRREQILLPQHSPSRGAFETVLHQ